MERRTFLSNSAATLALGAASAPPGRAHGGDPSPTDLRPAVPIGLPTAPGPPPGDGQITAPENGGEFRVLQFTDVHFFADREKFGEKRDLETVDAMRRTVDHTDPHLIAVTGDLWHDNPQGRGQEFFEFGLDKVVSLGLPWLFVWGNHDLLDDYPAAQAKLSGAGGSLYRGGHSGGNYRVALSDNKKRPLWDLICLNTTTQGVQSPQERWLENAAGRGSPAAGAALCFLHIPLLQYDTAWKMKRARGVRHEDVFTYGEDGSGLGALNKSGRVKACFCGHDHVNDYGGFHDGVELVYGRATGHAGYGGDKLKKGAKLITLDTGGTSYRWKTVFADGTSWTPS